MGTRRSILAAVARPAPQLRRQCQADLDELVSLFVSARTTCLMRTRTLFLCRRRDYCQVRPPALCLSMRIVCCPRPKASCITTYDVGVAPGIRSPSYGKITAAGQGDVANSHIGVFQRVYLAGPPISCSARVIDGRCMRIGAGLVRRVAQRATPVRWWITCDCFG